MEIKILLHLFASWTEGLQIFPVCETGVFAMSQNFSDLYKSILEGVLSADAYEKLVSNVGDTTWYGMENTGTEEMELQTLNGQQTRSILEECLASVQKRNLVSTNYPYTYAKDVENPLLIKVYDPMKCGSSCSVTAPAPWWIFSTIKPEQSEIDSIFPKKKKKLFGILG